MSTRAAERFKLDLSTTEEVLLALAQRIEEEPNSIGPMYVQIRPDRFEAVLLRNVVNIATNYFELFHDLLERQLEEGK